MASARLPHLLCLAVVLALALAALGGGSASADALCEDEAIEGACELPYKKEVAFSAGSGLLEFAGSPTTKCEKSTIKGKLSEEPTAEKVALKASITSLTFEKCSTFVLGTTISCTVVATHLPYKASLLWSEKSSGKLKVENGGSGTPGAISKCASIECTFSTEPTLEVVGGNPAKVIAKNAAVTSSKGFGCPSGGATLSATYTLTEPGAGKAFVAALARPKTVFCTTLVARCPQGLQYAAGGAGQEYEGELTAASSFKYEINGAPKENLCFQSTFKFKALANGAPLLAETRAGSPSFDDFGCNLCSVEAQQLPYALEVEAKKLAEVDGKAKLRLRSGGSGPPLFKLDCGGALHCIYEAAGAAAPTEEIFGSLTKAGADAEFEFSGSLEQVEGSSGACSQTMEWAGAYKIVNLGSQELYATRS